jgi:octaprenyl-diphosphate synthase
VLDLLNRYGSVDAANRTALEYADAARASIRDFPESEFKRALLWIPEFVVEREK